jgi:hypothetical protein
VNRYFLTGKEIVRHMLGKVGLNAVLLAARRKRGIRSDYLNAASRRERFEQVYESKAWTLGRAGVPLSGAGSSLDATAAIRQTLPTVLKRIGSATLLDVGCGDQTWMSAVKLEQRYIGVDIVPAVIAANRSRYGSARRQFHCLDAVTDELPEADTVLCRDVLFHLSFADAIALVRNLARKERRYLIATTDRATLFNADIKTGDFRILNLARAPFGLPPPDTTIDDAGVRSGRQLGVWKFAELPDRLRRS